MKIVESSLEKYNLINYLKIIDLSLLNLIDYLDLSDETNIIEVDDRLVLNFNSKIKKLLEEFVKNNIDNNIYYGYKNILIDTCIPKENWRCIKQNLNKNCFKYSFKDDSIYIDPLKTNIFFSSLFKKMSNTNVLDFEFKNLKFLSFKSIDISDVCSILNDILSNFGNVNIDNLNLTLIEDGNYFFIHNRKFMNELIDEVRLMLINKGII